MILIHVYGNEKEEVHVFILYEFIDTFILFSRAVSLIGLLLIALGTGGIKPCVSAFGGDQFVLPQQERQLAQFFSIFYFRLDAFISFR